MICTVSQVVSKVKRMLEGEFRILQVEGEVTNLSRSGSGHWYFTLSDKRALLRAALFRADAQANPVIGQLKDGDQVVCAGAIGVYLKGGSFQIIVRSLEPVGKGDLKERFEKLKKKLEAEGLFDMKSKKVIPPLAKRIGIVTAEQGAVLQDFLNIYKRRGLWMDILLAPAVVQGKAAAKSIRQAYHDLIKYSMNAPAEKKLEVIVLARGGGSLEDLWAFNDEALVWDIYNSPVPTISAVGHQVDFVLSDYVADLRCETPSAAAEVLTDGQYKLKNRMVLQARNLCSLGNEIAWRCHRRLEMVSPRSCADILRGQFNRQRIRLERVNLGVRPMELTRIHEKKFQLDEVLGRLQRSSKDFFQERRRMVERYGQILTALGPDNVLSRGYTYIKDAKGGIVSDSEKFKRLGEGSAIKIRFYDGEVETGIGACRKV